MRFKANPFLYCLKKNPFLISLAIQIVNRSTQLQIFCKTINASRNNSIPMNLLEPVVKFPKPQQIRCDRVKMLIHMSFAAFFTVCFSINDCEIHIFSLLPEKILSAEVNKTKTSNKINSIASYAKCVSMRLPVVVFRLFHLDWCVFGTEVVWRIAAGWKMFIHNLYTLIYISLA